MPDTIDQESSIMANNLNIQVQPIAYEVTLQMATPQNAGDFSGNTNILTSPLWHKTGDNKGQTDPNAGRDCIKQSQLPQSDLILLLMISTSTIWRCISSCYYKYNIWNAWNKVVFKHTKLDVKKTASVLLRRNKNSKTFSIEFFLLLKNFECDQVRPFFYRWVRII